MAFNIEKYVPYIDVSALVSRGLTWRWNALFENRPENSFGGDVRSTAAIRLMETFGLARRQHDRQGIRL